MGQPFQDELLAVVNSFSKTPFIELDSTLDPCAMSSSTDDNGAGGYREEDTSAIDLEAQHVNGGSASWQPDAGSSREQ